ncbi:Dynein heavy chain 14, axonemal [Fukomys damarensis]|uniref:Dynein heavy chain 14, axonemal n=2 Tax=Fukomys damarensis TaxID=885580 RepID=A0A091D4D2_FUKDA|nr:Dynein heavy chain 14, axonemal [Fukomys damarensis]
MSCKWFCPTLNFCYGCSLLNSPKRNGPRILGWKPQNVPKVTALPSGPTALTRVVKCAYAMYCAGSRDSSEPEGLTGTKIAMPQIVSFLTIIGNSMSLVNIYSYKFLKYCTMVEKAKALSMNISSMGELTSAQFNTILHKFKNYFGHIVTMAIEKRIGIFSVLSFDYQSECLLYIDNIIHMSQDLLLHITEGKNTSLLEIVESSLRQLECDPTKMEEFVEHFTFLDEISSEISELEKEYLTVSQLYSVVRHYQINVSEEQIAIYTILCIKFNQLKTVIKFSKLNKDATITKFRDNLEECITDLRVDVSNLKAKVEGPQLQDLSTEDSLFPKKLENAMNMGASVLLQILSETLSPVLKATLKKDIYQKRGQYFIRIDDSEIEYSSQFRLYLSTEIDNPHFLPSVYSVVTMISFTVTFQGLQDQLLSTMASHEVPHLEEQHSQLLERIALDSLTLEEMEEKTLNLLQNSQGCVLDDEEIIDTLRKCKMTSNEIAKRIQATEKAESEIQAIREKYLPTATRGVLLYFLTASLARVDHMYQFSLGWFRQVFVSSVVSKNKEQEHSLKKERMSLKKVHEIKNISEGPDLESEKNPLDKHIKNAIDTLTRNIFKVVSSALFNQHKLCFSFRLCTTIMQNNADGNLRPDGIGFRPEREWNLFLYSSILINIENILSKPRLDRIFEMCKNQHLPWLSESRWRQYQHLSRQLEPFSLLCKSLLSNPPQWNAFKNSHTELDLTSILLRFAQEVKGTTHHVTTISLARGQVARAEELLVKALSKRQQWVFLQNCHLAAAFMPQLCAIVESFNRPDVTIDPEFRLWLSSKSDSSFPIPILQKGVKVAVELPQGLKSNLLQMFGYSGGGEVTEEIFENPDYGQWWKKLLFSLCFFNAVINERKNYGTLCWNIAYKFISSDLEVSIKVLASVLQRHADLPWEQLRCLVGEVVYGGRITDPWDRRCLDTLLCRFCNPEVLRDDFTFSGETKWLAFQICQLVPRSASFQDYIHIIQSVPDEDAPEILGMHPEATQSCREAQGLQFTDGLIAMQPSTATVTLAIRPEQSPDMLVMEILCDIQAQLPLAVEKDNGAVGATLGTLQALLASPTWESVYKNMSGLELGLTHLPIPVLITLKHLKQTPPSSIPSALAGHWPRGIEISGQRWALRP